jgi:hypothetical protein
MGRWIPVWDRVTLPAQVSLNLRPSSHRGGAGSTSRLLLASLGRIPKDRVSQGHGEFCRVSVITDGVLSRLVAGLQKLFWLLNGKGQRDRFSYGTSSRKGLRMGRGEGRASTAPLHPRPIDVGSFACPVAPASTSGSITARRIDALPTVQMSMRLIAATWLHSPGQ